ncbi:unnamed protein product, partial [marine sediment metagenome]
RQGIAVLRVDDRGVGKSTGDFSQATSEDFASDVLAGIEYLKTRKEINPKQIGVIGHSEGGLIAPMVAVKSPDVAFIVLMAGTGLTGEEILYLQSSLNNNSKGRVKNNNAAMVVKMPREKDVASQKALLVDILPCSPINAIIKGMLAKWQGLNNILNIPQIKEAVKAIIGFN